jgi:hypothetical protein
VDSEVLIPRSLIMKAAVIHNYGAPDVLIYENYPDPKPAAGEVVVRVQRQHQPGRFARARRWDQALASCRVSGRTWLGPRGHHRRLGEGVRELAIGESVFGWAYHTYAELCAVKATVLAPVPAGLLDLDTAAAMPLVSATGCQLILLREGRPPCAS